MNETAHIAAAAAVILKLCDQQDDTRTQLKRIAYASEVLKYHAYAELEKLDSAAEVAQ